MFNALKWCLLIVCIFNFTCCTCTGISHCLENRRGLLFVSTLDGTLSALDINDEGKEKWAIHSGPGSLLSSNIHNLELIENSNWITLVPSLTGKLYKFDGHTVQPIPFNADNLLTSSFRFSDDVVISGGKETRFYGVNINNGEILYECSMANCDNQTGNGDATKDIIVLQRHTHTIRAIEPRTGFQRWNFSVGNHELKVIPREDCTEEFDKVMDVEIQVQGPNGVIFGINPSDSGLVLWNHKFESPITNVWKLVGNTLERIDLFSSTDSHDLSIGNNALLYMGIYEQQLYIQESAIYRRQQMLDLKNDEKMDSTKKDTKRISTDKEESRSQPRSTNAISLFHKSHNRGDGYYFYDSNKSYEPKELHKQIEPIRETEDETVGEVVIMTLWYYWKEVLLISLSTAVIVNYIIYRHMYRFVYWHVLPYFERNKSKSTDLTNNNDGSVSEKRDVSKEDTDSGISVQSTCNENYSSRYLQDFECVHLLGKGGFGVVYRARNIIDDCHYAVKRISLPSGLRLLCDRKKRREQVLREVRALAKLDHPNIVRFFNAWLEYPPAGWQLKLDKEYLLSHDVMNTNSMISGDHIIKQSNNKKKIELNTKSSAFNTKLDQFSDHAKTTTDSSFIVFEKDSNLISQEKSNNDDSNELKRDNVELNDACKNNDGCLTLLYIQMQLCQQNSLKDWLRVNTTERQPSSITSIFTQILTAVVYIHQQGMIHRDLKPSNIFFSLDGQIKVGDFGLVTCLEESGDINSMNDWNNLSLTNNAGTHIYMSPEQFSKKGYNYKVDIYALGIILFELLTPFDTEMERYKTLINLRSGIFPHSFISTHKTEYKLLTTMLSHNPEIRPTALQLKESLK